MHPQKGFQEGARNLAEPGVRSPAREALSRVLPRPKSPQETCFLLSLPDPSAPLSSLAKEMSLASQRSKAEPLRASLSLSLSSPLLCFRGNTKCCCECLSPRAERADIFSTTLLAVAVSPEKATLSDGLFPSGFLLPPRRPLPPPLSWSDSLSFQ